MVLMVPAQMEDYLRDAMREVDMQHYEASDFVGTAAIQNLIKYIDDLEAELVVRRAADTPNPQVIKINLGEPIKVLDSTGLTGV
jgi:hypothetical protein